MLEISKKFLLYSLMTISSISLINMAVLYWFPIQTPFSSYSATSLMATIYFLKLYYLVPISLAICVLMFFTAMSFSKEQMLLPVILSVYLVCDLFILAYSFFDAWYNDEHFITMQFVQLVISVIIIIFNGIYFILLRKQRAINLNQQSPHSKPQPQTVRPTSGGQFEIMSEKTELLRGGFRGTYD